ncbi:MAG: LytTR family DNA-binding domain-containing protein [Clostridiales bacterium]|jgi:DNA-binding LytR/AlgR family response regulator|nr:LytTR family DNA-binding domain-containing protein [Clostridiales bacterium]
MINIAVVEDEDDAAELLTGFLKKYQKEKGVQFGIARFKDAFDFLDKYKQLFDIVFMDIKMPGINGMQAAYKIRKFDKQAVLIFVTSLAQFAVKGYEVDALNYIVKPVQYEKLSFVITKAVGIVNTNAETEVAIPQNDGIIRVSSKEIHYIEVSGHKLSYHTERAVLNGYGSLSGLEQSLRSRNFMRCNSCYLVNPKHIVSVSGQEVKMRNGDILKISQPKRKAFLNGLANWLGKGNFN